MLSKYTNPNLAYRTMQPYALYIGSVDLTFWIIMEIYTLRASERPYDAFLDPIHTHDALDEVCPHDALVGVAPCMTV